MISRNAPDSWQALQTEVGRILRECGFDVEVEKKIQSARGTVECKRPVIPPHDP